MQSLDVTVIDYGVGNLLSVSRALEYCGAKVLVTSDANAILRSRKIVFPGVGSFPNAMEKLTNLGLISTLQQFAASGKPFLGICLGMQLLLEESSEFGSTPGLGIIPGRVVQVPKYDKTGEILKIPHIGWSTLLRSNTRRNWSNTILESTEEGAAAYFVHSFMAKPENMEDQIAHTVYGGHEIISVVKSQNITGCQFHPEKSGEIGLNILRSFLKE